MKSKLMALCAAGALVLMALPATVSAANPQCSPSGVGPIAAGATDKGCYTNLTMTVTEGTTIWAPASIALGSGYPGEVVKSATNNVYWISNEAGKHLKVTTSGLTDPAVGKAAPKTIDAEDMSYVESAIFSQGAAGSAAGEQNLTSGYEIALLTADDTEVPDATPGDPAQDQSAFQIWVYVPSVTASTAYVGTLTFAVV